MTTSNTTTRSSTSTAPPLGAPPTVWTEMGFYVEIPQMPPLDLNVNPNGDASLSVPKCWQTCYRGSYQYTDLQNGDQCWCGSCVGGEWAANQTACNCPCTGNRSAFCGGPGLLRIYKADENVPSTTAAGAVVATTTPASGAKRDSGAVKNPGVLWNPLDSFG